jgi:hypothetical protein
LMLMLVVRQAHHERAEQMKALAPSLSKDG